MPNMSFCALIDRSGLEQIDSEEDENKIFDLLRPIVLDAAVECINGFMEDNNVEYRIETLPNVARYSLVYMHAKDPDSKHKQPKLHNIIFVYEDKNLILSVGLISNLSTDLKEIPIFIESITFDEGKIKESDIPMFVDGYSQDCLLQVIPSTRRTYMYKLDREKDSLEISPVHINFNFGIQ